jgi:hypothetical protein
MTAERPEHRACRDPEPMFSAADMERARAEGRREANNAITWNTSCLGCAEQLDSLYAERVAGGMEIASFIAAEIRVLYAETGDRALLEAADIAKRHALGGPASTESAQKAWGEVVDTNAAESLSAGPPFDWAAG